MLAEKQYLDLIDISDDLLGGCGGFSGRVDTTRKNMTNSQTKPVINDIHIIFWHLVKNKMPKNIFFNYIIIS